MPFARSTPLEQVVIIHRGDVTMVKRPGLDQPLGTFESIPAYGGCALHGSLAWHLSVDRMSAKP